jgi:Na+/citrate or Na+/malate symporter
MRDVLARIRKYWLPVGPAVVVLAVLWLVSVFPDQVGVHLDTNVTMLTLSIGGGLLAASVAPKHPLRNGMLGGAALLALAGATVTVYRAALGEVNVDEYGSWEMYWLLSLFALMAFAIIGAVLGYVGGYIVRFASQEHPRMHPR